MPRPAALLSLITLLAAPVAHADPVSEVQGFAKLDRSKRDAARAALEQIPCYHGCTGTLAKCLAAKPRVKTAWRVARYVVFLAGKGLNQETIAKVIERRRQSVQPVKVHKISVAGAPCLGDAKAPLTVVEYSDFECPHCTTVSPLLERLAAAYKGKVVLCFKVYPLRFKGPPLIAARAALAAHRQGKFWKMTRLLFAHKDLHTEAGVEQLARKAGLDLDRFRAALKDVNLLKQIEANRIEGLRLGVKGTPTLFFAGKPHLLRKDEYHLRDRIEEELELLGR